MPKFAHGWEPEIMPKAYFARRNVGGERPGNETNFLMSEQLIPWLA
jgi:hypothetical protein